LDGLRQLSLTHSRFRVFGSSCLWSRVGKKKAPCLRGDGAARGSLLRLQRLQCRSNLRAHNMRFELVPGSKVVPLESANARRFFRSLRLVFAQ
jgi:hypothetical protein